MTMDIYDNISPIDFRYYIGNEKLFKKLQPYLSEKAFIAYQLKVEVALAKALADHGVCSKDAAQEIENACEKVTAKEVYEEDARIKHSTRALVNCIREKISDDAKPYVHFTTTSFDITDTANAARYKAFSQEILLPELKSLQKTLVELALREKATIQIGRTHGQHAVPITFGYAIAEYVERLGNVTMKINAASNNLRGKISGAVGSYNSQNLFIDDPETFEKDVLLHLALEPGGHATQIVQPEYLLDLLHHVVACQGILANLADDMRHLQRSEINEVAEQFDKNQVGSSTMPHKRNPWNFENIKSMWKATMPRLMTYYMDQICEHQRDLSNSASGRFIPELFTLVIGSIQRMNSIMSRIIVDKEHIKRNFEQNKEMIIAEAVYLLLASHHHPDAHEYVRNVTLESQKTGTPLRTLVANDKSIAAYWKKFTKKQQEVIAHPERYIGICTEKTEKICKHWKDQFD